MNGAQPLAVRCGAIGALIGGPWPSWRAAWKRPPWFWQSVEPPLFSRQSRKDFIFDVTTALRTSHASLFGIRSSLLGFLFFNWKAFSAIWLFLVLFAYSPDEV